MKRFSLTGSSRNRPVENIPSIDLEFEDLSYFVRNSLAARKQILKSMNGKFLSGQLTGILGSSGAGKSTLLNVLAGYVLDGVQGDIKLNGRLREIHNFHRLSTYIMQDNLVQPYLTVKEEMMMAAHLKLGNFTSETEKQFIVEEILKKLRLGDCHATEVLKLSGGQRKRLSVGLELIGNPPIILLDEPTSGLDSVSIKQCLDVLKALAGEGRTVVCTIHQPSVKTMQLFDQVYFIGNGMCVYNGPPEEMLQFLSLVQLECPLNYSHADFLVEVVETNPSVIPMLVNATNNGKHYVEKCNRKFVLNKEDVTLSEQILSPTSFWTQFYLLLHRMMLQQRRNKLSLWIHFLSHTVVGLCFGTVFFGIGRDASMILVNFKLLICIQIFLVYCYVMSTAMLFPFELLILKQEYFNRWYGLRAYYLAMLFRGIPLMILLVTEFMVIMYCLTDQPLEFERFYKLSFVAIITSSIAEGIGLVFGTMFNSKNAATFTPAIVTPWMVVMIHGFGYVDQLGLVLNFMMSSSFARRAFLAMNIGLFHGRDPMYCPDEKLLCYYKDTNLYLKDLGALNTTFWKEILIMFSYVIIFRLIAFINLRLQLNPERFRFLYKNLCQMFRRH